MDVCLEELFYAGGWREYMEILKMNEQEEHEYIREYNPGDYTSRGAEDIPRGKEYTNSNYI